MAKVEKYDGIWYEVGSKYGLILMTKDEDTARREYNYQRHTSANIDIEFYQTLYIERQEYENGRLVDNKLLIW